MPCKLPQPLSAAEETFALHCRVEGLRPEREWQFHPTRKWRLDFAFPEIKLAVEVEGVTGGLGGRHQRVGGMEKDCEKYNAAVMLDWRVLRYTPAMVKSGQAIADVLEVFKSDALRR